MALSIEKSNSFTAATTVALAASTVQGDQTETLEQVQNVTIQTGGGTSEATVDPIFVVMGGDATAIGTDTYAVGEYSGSIDANGLMTVASGEAFNGAVASAQDAQAYASATNYADISGAEHFVLVNHTAYDAKSNNSESIASSTADLSFAAFEFDGRELDGIAQVASTDFNTPTTTPSDEPLTFKASFEASGLPDTAEGNVAVLEVHADVYAVDTYLALDAELLTVEDTLSFVVTNLELGYA